MRGQHAGSRQSRDLRAVLLEGPSTINDAEIELGIPRRLCTRAFWVLKIMGDAECIGHVPQPKKPGGRRLKLWTLTAHGTRKARYERRKERHNEHSTNSQAL